MEFSEASPSMFDEESINSLDSEANPVSDSSSDIAASDDDYDSLREFCFETPRMAYKANTDYKELVQATVLWKAQLAQAKRDKQMLLRYKERAAADPFQFLEDIKERKVEFPKRQKIASVPNINFQKYNASDLNLERSRKSGGQSCEEAREEDGYCNESRHNQQWSETEQKHLESLLLVYPPEEVEARRWEKIASALGTRTPRQVASRVQKYFIKLAKAGEPVPGRVPNFAFLNKYKKRIRTKDSSNASSRPKCSKYEEIEVSDEEDVRPELRNTPEYEELILIKKVLKAKNEENSKNHGQGTSNLGHSSSVC